VEGGKTPRRGREKKILGEKGMSRKRRKSFTSLTEGKKRGVGFLLFRDVGKGKGRGELSFCPWGRKGGEGSLHQEEKKVYLLSSPQGGRKKKRGEVSSFFPRKRALQGGRTSSQKKDASYSGWCARGGGGRDLPNGKGGFPSGKRDVPL